MRAEMRDRFEVVEHKIALVAEGVLGANERIDRLEGKVEHLAGRIDYLSVKVNHLAAEMNSDFGDLRSLMKYSYTDLDQRVRNLEQR
jgi:archaellum component FlaC